LLLVGTGSLAVYAAIPGQTCRARSAQAQPLQQQGQPPPAQNPDWTPDPNNPQQECRRSRSHGGSGGRSWFSSSDSSHSATHSTASRGGFGGSGGGHGFGG
jgi:hypothetical protein